MLRTSSLFLSLRLSFRSFLSFVLLLLLDAELRRSERDGRTARHGVAAWLMPRQFACCESGSTSEGSRAFVRDRGEREGWLQSSLFQLTIGKYRARFLSFFHRGPSWYLSTLYLSDIYCRRMFVLEIIEINFTKVKYVRAKRNLFMYICIDFKW